MVKKVKVAVISGGERGLGFALSLILINEGFKVFSLDVNRGHRVVGKTFLKADISSEGDVRRTMKKIGSIDLLINNAGIMRRGDIFSSSVKDFDDLFSVNVKGSWLFLKHSLSYLNKGAVVVMVSSRHSSLPINPGLYGLSKKNVELLAELLKKESLIKKKNVFVKTAVLGPFRSELSKQGYSLREYNNRSDVLSKEVVAEKVFKLICSNKKKLSYGKKYYFS